MTYYAIGKKIMISGDGQGDGGGEYMHICPKDIYMGDRSFYPLFESKELAEKYIIELKTWKKLEAVELTVNI